MSNAILFSYGLNGTAAGKALQGAQIAEVIKSDDLGWVHLDATHQDTAPWLHENLSYLDPFIAAALIAEETRPRVTVIGDGALIIIRGVNANAGADPEDMISVRLWIDPHRIISVQRRASRSVFAIADELGKGHGPHDAGGFIGDLIARLTRNTNPVINEIDDLVDDLEETLLKNADKSQRHHINEVRRKTIVLRRFLAPQRDAIVQLRDSELPWLAEVDRRHLNESIQSVQRHVEDLDMIRDRAQVVKEELTNTLADQMNRNMYVLSVIAAIFLPLGFLTGLLGINIGGMPGANNPHAFWIFIGGMTVIVALQIWLFRRMKWF